MSKLFWESVIKKPSYKVPRLFVGIVAAVCLVVGGLIYFLQPNPDPFWLGMLIRVGALLGVISLAFPELMSLKGKLPAVFFGLAAICIVLIAVRPNPGRILISLIVIGIGVGSVMKWISSITRNDPRKR